MKRFYWVVKNSQRVGPFGLEALQEKVDRGEFGGGDFVFYPGCKGLEKLATVEGIRIEVPQGRTPGYTPAAPRSAAPAPTPAPAPATAPRAAESLPPLRQNPAPAAPQRGAVNLSPELQQVADSLPPIRQTEGVPHTFQRTTEAAPPPRARMPEPAAAQERPDAYAPGPVQEPRTVAPRTGFSHSAPERLPEPEPTRPAQLISRRDLPVQKDSTQRLDAALPASPQRREEEVAATDPARIEIDFSSLEAALQKPAPTGASTKIPAPSAGARPLSPEPLAHQAPAPPAPAETRMVTQRMDPLKPPAPLGAPAFLDDMFGKQTMVVSAPGRAAPVRPRSSGESQYVDVISKPEEEAPPPEPEILTSVKYAELAKPTEQVQEVEAEFTNSLGMGFVQVQNLPVGFSIWPTRVRDFRMFCDHSGYDAGPKWRSPDFLQLEDNPVIFVSWLDAQAFCEWLTAAEQEAGWIDADQYYRLPTDVEWSAAVGLRNEPGNTPEARAGRIKDIFPWGKTWPPPARVGNFADESAARRFGWEPIAAGYDDGQVYTSKVGTFHMSSAGLYDLAGNVWEWVEDWYDATHSLRTLRGGSWVTNRKEDLYSSARDSDATDARRGKNGFRVVLSAR